jgi:hypothetical protein
MHCNKFKPAHSKNPLPIIIVGISSLALLVSTLALLVSTIGVWFNFYREVAHLKTVVSQAFGNIDEEVSPFAKFDAQASKATYSIVFFNDGNKDIVVTSISQALMKVDVQQRAGDLIRGIFGTTTVDAQKTPICNEQSENGLQEYYSDEQQKSQGAFVVKAGQFYIMSGATFFPMPIFTNVATEGTPSTIASCFHIEFVKPNGSAGDKSVLAAQFF